MHWATLVRCLVWSLQPWLWGILILQLEKLRLLMLSNLPKVKLLSSRHLGFKLRLHNSKGHVLKTLEHILWNKYFNYVCTGLETNGKKNLLCITLEFYVWNIKMFIFMIQTSESTIQKIFSYLSINVSSREGWGELSFNIFVWLFFWI